MYVSTVKLSFMCFMCYRCADMACPTRSGIMLGHFGILMNRGLRGEKMLEFFDKSKT